MIVNSLVGAARAVLLAFAFLALATPARAQQPSASAIAVAKEIINVKGSAAGYNAVVSSMIERAKGMLMQTNPMLGRDLNEVAAKLRTDFASISTQPLNDAAKLYASKFTEAELKSVLAFYKTPVGQKVIEQEPLIFQQSMRELDTWSEKLGPEIMSKFRTEMKKKGMTSSSGMHAASKVGQRSSNA